jgi:hypothetical protein
LVLGVFVSRKDAKGKERKGILFGEGFSDLLASLLFVVVVTRRFCFARRRWGAEAQRNFIWTGLVNGGKQQNI